MQWAGVPEPEVILPAEDNITEPLAVNTSSEAKRKSKTKYSCKKCGINAWAKPKTNLVCGDCDLPLHAVKPKVEPK